MPQAQAAVDILPVQGSRKVRQFEAEAEAESAVDPSWAQQAPATNPWTGVTEPAPQAGPEQPAPEQPAAAPEAVPSGPSPLVYAGAIPPPVSVPVFPGAGVPAVGDPADADPTTPGAKRFLGMQLRRPRRADDAGADEQELPDQSAPAPVAAWPTDVGVGVVATAEPESLAPWGPPVGYAVDDVPDLVPAEVVPAQEAVQAPAEPVQPAADPVATPLPVPPADDALRSMRTLVEASDARRTAAEHRADNAVAYAQQLQAELTRVQSELESKLQAAEVRVRSNANEAQDWQIRHREAQTQITELAASLAGAEQRLSDLRAERDDLMSQLEDATSPDRESVAEQLES
jgi:hypothetical protein